MPNTPNPLQSMSHVVSHDLGQEERPDESFMKTALPGFEQALKARRSIREYDGKPIPEAVMRDCLGDAILAPSSSNLQTYELYWVRDAEKKELIANACLGQPVATTAGELVVVVARTDLWKDHLDKLVDIMTHGGDKPLPEPVSDYYNKIVPMVMRNDAFGVNNLIRRFIYWYIGKARAIHENAHQPGGPSNLRSYAVIFGRADAVAFSRGSWLRILSHWRDGCTADSKSS